MSESFWIRQRVASPESCHLHCPPDKDIFFKSPYASVYTPADLREGSDVSILIFCQSTSAHFSLIHDS
jgi:hypothetical protein